MRLLIDECLSASLAADAIALGHDAAHIGWRGRLGAQDWTLFRYAQAEAAFFVTNNRHDFLDLHGRAEVHAGLGIIVPSCGINAQRRLFAHLLRSADELGHTLNTLIEIFSDGELRTRPWHAGAYDAAYVASPGRAP